MNPRKLLADNKINSRQAYHAWCKQYHPDKCKDANATARFQQMQNAYRAVYPNGAPSRPKPKPVPKKRKVVSDIHKTAGIYCEEITPETQDKHCYRYKEKRNGVYTRKCYFHNNTLVTKDTTEDKSHTYGKHWMTKSNIKYPLLGRCPYVSKHNIMCSSILSGSSRYCYRHKS